VKQNRTFIARSWLRVAFFNRHRHGAALTGQLCWLLNHSLAASCWYSSREHLHSTALCSADGPNPRKQRKAKPVGIVTVARYTGEYFQCIIRSSHTLAWSASRRHASRYSIRHPSLPIHR